jgi:hypothetical protein
MSSWRGDPQRRAALGRTWLPAAVKDDDDDDNDGSPLAVAAAATAASVAPPAFAATVGSSVEVASNRRGPDIHPNQ